jgi:hypothetical protein
VWKDTLDEFGITVDQLEVAGKLRELCTRLVAKAKEVVARELATEKQAELIVKLDGLIPEIRYDEDTGWKFTHKAEQFSRWVNFNIPHVEFFKSLDDGLYAAVVDTLSSGVEQSIGRP